MEYKEDQINFLNEKFLWKKYPLPPLVAELEGIEGTSMEYKEDEINFLNEKTKNFSEKRSSTAAPLPSYQR